MNSPDDESTVRLKLESCIADIKTWMTDNKLKLNDDKSELVIFTSRRMHSKVLKHHIQIAEVNIQSTISARNLGIVLDENM